MSLTANRDEEPTRQSNRENIQKRVPGKFIAPTLFDLSKAQAPPHFLPRKIARPTINRSNSKLLPRFQPRNREAPVETNLDPIHRKSRWYGENIGPSPRGNCWFANQSSGNKSLFPISGARSWSASSSPSAFGWADFEPGSGHQRLNGRTRKSAP